MVGIDVDQSFEGLRRNIAALDDKIAELRGEQEADRGNLEAEKERMSSLAEQSVCPLCSQNLTSDYKIALVKRIQEENDKRQDRMNELTGEISDLQKQRSKAATSLTALQGLLPRIDDLKARIKEETDGLNKLSDELEQRRAQEEKVTAELRGVQEELGKFDVSGLEKAKTEREQAFRHYYSSRVRSSNEGKSQEGPIQTFRRDQRTNRLGAAEN